MAERVIEIEGLRKSYGDVEAVAGIDVHVDRGEVFALLGPERGRQDDDHRDPRGVSTANGRRSVEVLGHDPAKGEHALKQRIGIVLQSTGVDPFLTVRETIEMYGGYYPSPASDRRGDRGRRAHREDATSASEQAERRAAAPARRRDRARRRSGALFLDEPTTGFDPSARRNAWEMVKNLVVDRQDRVAHDALHGRGAVPRGSGRGDRRRADRGRGSAGALAGARPDADDGPVPAFRTAPPTPPGLRAGTGRHDGLLVVRERDADDRARGRPVGRSSTASSSKRSRSRIRPWRTSTSS